MATKCRKLKKETLVNICTYGTLAGLVLGGGVLGFITGTVTAPMRTDTGAEVVTIEVPTLKADRLPETTDTVYYDIPLSENLQRYIFEICESEGVPVALVMAMIEHESAFNPDAVSSTDDYGLMQINEVNHDWLEKEYRCADMMNPYQNVFCGIQIVASYLEKYNGDLHKVLMAYNMGDYGANKAWKNGVKSTYYSTRIIELMRHY